ncbi:type II toxin-antitoxin system ParD family antitoxin [Rhizobium sp. FKL33]|uniref:type II toxin-antitoxin system ParD family antitoxin n=1 Tax=Rhizobium sp. FKL33 TaxID=2562307 RepID=UPI0010C10B93|nr:type II toxin-antitoxin system ParD family antitoxin [Rhizobium sp. FKL33]
MAAKHSLNITLPQDIADLTGTKVDAGEYADACAAIDKSLRYLAERDASIERWLIEDVAPTYDKMKSNPERGLSPDDVRKRLDTRAAAHRETSEP